MTAAWETETPKGENLKLDPSPSSDEEEEELFLTPEERESHQLRNAKLKLENDQFERDMDNREGFAKKAYLLTAAWAAFILMLTGCQFALAKRLNAGLSEKEFITISTTTTASVFGFWLLVGRYLFSRPTKGPGKRGRKRYAEGKGTALRRGRVKTAD